MAPVMMTVLMLVTGVVAAWHGSPRTNRIVALQREVLAEYQRDVLASAQLASEFSRRLSEVILDAIDESRVSGHGSWQQTDSEALRRLYLTVIARDDASKILKDAALHIVNTSRELTGSDSYLDRILFGNLNSMTAPISDETSVVVQIMQGGVKFEPVELALDATAPLQIWTVGREKGCDIRLSVNDPFVACFASKFNVFSSQLDRSCSRLHFMILALPAKGVMIIDVESTNGLRALVRWNRHLPLKASTPEHRCVMYFAWGESTRLHLSPTTQATIWPSREICPVCWERSPEYRFLCGHLVCSACYHKMAGSVVICPVCRAPNRHRDMHSLNRLTIAGTAYSKNY